MAQGTRYPSVTVSFKASDAITANRFVQVTGPREVSAITAVTEVPLGVAIESVTAGQDVAVDIGGVAIVTASAALSAGVAVGISANGRIAAAGANNVVGILIDTVAAAGELASVALVGPAMGHTHS